MTTTTTTGIRDPEKPNVWLVWPWPVEAGFCKIVRHFLTCLWPLFGDTNPARQLAYYEGYQAALLAATTDDLRGPGALEWREELLACVARCVTTHRAQVQAGREVLQVPPTAAQEWAP
ncbi:MAG TPA: hypothetical protein VHV49_14015 [Pseudonocardiaceae bacterium]|nr:hypothetical protein [Pseudonocardiaceae bacterium]